jgi:alcohol dehydrogenase class IV
MGYVFYRCHMGPSHAIGHQLGSVGKVLHGITSCIMLAPVLKKTKDWNPTQQQTVLDVFNACYGWEEREAGDAVERFVKMLGLPTRLSEVGVSTDDQMKQIAERTKANPWLESGKELVDKNAEVLEILDMVR